MLLMQNGASAHPYVDSVSVMGNQITLRVEVTDFKATEGGLEISGLVTQTGGAFANFSEIVDIATATSGDNGELFVDVTADTAPPYPFRKDQDVTVFVRVAKVWVTVLGEHSTAGAAVEATDASPDTTWDQLRARSAVGWSTDPWGGSM
jgi:hypothetical protein